MRLDVNLAGAAHHALQAFGVLPKAEMHGLEMPVDCGAGRGAWLRNHRPMNSTPMSVAPEAPVGHQTGCTGPARSAGVAVAGAWPSD